MVICSCVGHWASPGHRMLQGCSLMWRVPFRSFYKRPVCCSFCGPWWAGWCWDGIGAAWRSLPACRGSLGSVEPFLRCCMWLRGTGMLRMPGACVGGLRSESGGTGADGPPDSGPGGRELLPGGGASGAAEKWRQRNLEDLELLQGTVAAVVYQNAEKRICLPSCG